MEKIQENIDNIRKRIYQAACRKNKNASDITLVAVSKTVTSAEVRIANNLGINDFGENKIQDLKIKMDGFPKARWHMIGRLQTNKVKDIIPKIHLIHSLDRWKLAEEINKRGEMDQEQVATLIQINISQEYQKAGLNPNDLKDFLQSIGDLKYLNIYGLMTMAANEEEMERTRPVFKELYLLNEKMKKLNFKNVDLKYLSMGMSQDFEIAVEEGANILRIGSALFKS